MAVGQTQLSRLQSAGILLLVAGAGLMAAADRWPVPTRGPGIVVVGAAVALAGLDSVRRGRFESGHGGTRLSYSGAAARDFGLAFLLVGVAVVIGGLADTVGAADALGRLVQDRPGTVMLPAGVLLVLVGHGLTGRWRRDVGGRPSLLTRLPGILGGSLLMAIGVGVALLGGYGLLVPGALGDLIPWN
jgi:hypothetical protein